MKFAYLVLGIFVMSFIVEGGKTPSTKKIWKKLKKIEELVKKDIKKSIKNLKANQNSWKKEAKKDISSMEKKLEDQGDKVDGVESSIYGLNQKLEDQGYKFDGVESSIDGMNQKLEDHGDKFDGIESSINGFDDLLAKIILEDAGEDLITDEDLQGTRQEVIGKMAQKVLYSPVNPKGIPFKPINGPKGNDTRIGVVGGGIGGVHMAYLLKKKGFNNVTILEKTNRVGGLIDSTKVRGIKTTWHIWSWIQYKTTLLPLLEEFGFGPHMINISRDLYGLWAQNDYSIPIMDRSVFLLSQVMQEYQIQDPNIALQLVIKQCAEYINIYTKLFGKNGQALMRRPDPLYMPLLSGTAMDFIERFNLKAILPMARAWFNMYGYGTMTTLPVSYLFLNLKPEILIEDFFALPKGSLNNRSIDEIFPMMIQDQNINTIFDFEVSHIEKLDTGEYKLYSQDSDSEEFDFLIWAGLPSDLPQLLYPCEMKNYLSELFSTQKPSHVNYFSLSMRNRIGPPVQVYSQQLNSDELDNSVMVDLDNYACQNGVSVEDYENNNFTYGDGSSAEIKSFWSLQYCYCKPSEADSIQGMMKHYDAFNATDIEIDEFRAWDNYYPRWDIDSAAQGKLWDLYDFQGTENVWIVGAGATFGHMHTIMEYNELLLSNMI